LHCDGRWSPRSVQDRPAGRTGDRHRLGTGEGRRNLASQKQCSSSGGEGRIGKVGLERLETELNIAIDSVRPHRPPLLATSGEHRRRVVVVVGSEQGSASWGTSQAACWLGTARGIMRRTRRAAEEEVGAHVRGTLVAVGLDIPHQQRHEAYFCSHSSCLAVSRRVVDRACPLNPADGVTQCRLC
jgi:hypothetical protein